ncbi:protein TILLER ANGLE CONTROL 1 [Cornus florida]|uniref:protein TILLER ANGLE CONTROL 1 n=1 Tax=Cornus florida TaxID=4283 RepID=UPI00289D9BD6|nr:protein TILLER ANGLE CONTROL 1 [Cornus florida]
MKIFNWVHRRFHHKDGIGGNAKKPEFVRDDSDTQALLERVILIDVFDGWKDGILTIGTLGFEPLKNFNYEKLEYPITEDNDEEEEEDCDDGEECFDNEDEDDNNDMEVESELNPLVVTACRHGFGMDSFTGSNCDENAAAKADLIMAIDGTPLCSSPHGLCFDSNNSEYGKNKKKGERTTLADLFSADSDAKTKPDHCKSLPESGKIRTSHSEKNCPKFSKKGIPRDGGDSHPIRKLRGLMKRMMKRKIHPDLEGKINKKDSQIKPCGLELHNGEYGANGESTTLLRTQDAMV